jgi:hypothetical protein
MKLGAKQKLADRNVEELINERNHWKKGGK